MTEKEKIIETLKKRGYRITKQRKILLDIILEERCSSCKEIYYKASEQDADIGTATVYRMINTLEEIGAIHRGNMYKIDWDDDSAQEQEYIIHFTDHSTISLSESRWKEVIAEGLAACGYSLNTPIAQIASRPVGKKAV